MFSGYIGRDFGQPVIIGGSSSARTTVDDTPPSIQANKIYSLGMESYSINADEGTATANMREGLVTYGNVTTPIGARSITVSGSPAYIVMRINRRLRSAGWIETTVSAIPQNNSQYIYVPFVEFQIAQGATIPSLYLTHHVGNLHFI